MICDPFSWTCKQQRIQKQTQADAKCHNPKSGASNKTFEVRWPGNPRHQEHQDREANADGSNDHAGAHASQPFLFRCFEKLFYFRKYVFGDFLEFASVLDFSNFGSDRPANFLARRHRSYADRVRPVQTHRHGAKLGAAGAAILTRLALFRSATWTKHDRSNIRLRVSISSASNVAAPAYARACDIPPLTAGMMQISALSSIGVCKRRSRLTIWLFTKTFTCGRTSPCSVMTRSRSPVCAAHNLFSASLTDAGDSSILISARPPVYSVR